MFDSTKTILATDNVEKMFKKTQHIGNNFSGLQNYMRIVFKNGLGTNKTKQALINHYGNKENSEETSFMVAKILMKYEYHLIRNKLDRKKSNNFMRWFENEMSIFGIDSQNLRCTDLVQNLRNLITYTTIDF